MITLLFAATLALAPQKIGVSVDVKPSEVVSGVRRFHLNITSNDPVTQVEFYVGTELRDSDSSIPYEFDLDTVDEKDGNLQLTFAAYTSKGDSEKKVLDIWTPYIPLKVISADAKNLLKEGTVTINQIVYVDGSVWKKRGWDYRLPADSLGKLADGRCSVF